MLIRRALCAIPLLALIGAAHAQDKYPSRPIMLISPYAAGGATETFARLLSEDFATIIGQPLVIEQRAGAAGTIGARYVASSKPDGYTLLANTSQHVMYEGMYRKLAFDAMKDFKPVGILGSSPILVVVAEASPYKSLKDVLEAAKTKDITYASGALGSLPHLTGERVASLAKVKMTHVPFSGNAPAVSNTLGGHVDMMYSTAPSVITQIKGGKMRALAVSTKERMPELPDVPTIAESGMAGFDVTAWYAVWAPKDTPNDVVRTLNETLRAASAKPATRKRMADASVTPSNLTAEQFATFAERERQTWLPVMKAAGLEPEN